MATNMVRITLDTNEYIDIELYPEIAPITVANFLKLIEQKYYDGVVFHRVIKDFMAQTGFYYKDEKGIGAYELVDSITGEFASNGIKNDLKHVKGVVSMARDRRPNSANSEFFICTADAPHLDGEYAAFGKVANEESFKVLEKINNVETVSIGAFLKHFPNNVIRIKTIRVI